MLKQHERHRKPSGLTATSATSTLQFLELLAQVGCGFLLLFGSLIQIGFQFSDGSHLFFEFHAKFGSQLMDGFQM
jgi:hypothetical protein